MKLIIGLGSVGFNFLQLIRDNNEFDPDSFYCIDPSDKAYDKWISIGGKPSNFIKQNVEFDNWQQLLSILKPGDYLLDFGMLIKNLEVVKYCLDRQIHYLNTADSSWPNDLSWRTVHQHFLEYLELEKQYGRGYHTSVIEFGMNPGLVSIFAKQCIKDIVKTSNRLFIRLFRKRLLKLLSRNEYGKVAKLLKVEYIQIVDRDNQQFNVEYKDNIIFSPWNTDAYYYESTSCPEIAYGKTKSLYNHKEFYDVDVKDKFIAPVAPAQSYKETTYNSHGEFTGSVIPHEEAFSIRRWFTYKEYSPTVFFIYKASDLACKSIENNLKVKPANSVLLTRENIISGGEEVGILIQGKRFNTHFFGNYIDCNKTPYSPTILQVAAGAYAAYKYIQNNPNEGMLFPEKLNEDYILQIALPILKQFDSVDVPKVNIKIFE